MIQINDWTLIAALLVVFLLAIVYLAYFIVSRKLFPNVLEFQNEIKPNEALIISSIKGSGIIKKIEMKTKENNQALISLTIDKTSYITFGLDKKISSPNRNMDPIEESLSLEINLNKAFEKNFAVFYNNNSDKSTQTNGKISYEIKKPLKITLKTLLSELFH